MHSSRRARTILLAWLAILPAACHAPTDLLATAPHTALDPHLASELGTWKGVRRRSADGAEESLTVVVRPVLGGAALASELEVRGADSTYRGLALDTFDTANGRWLRTYVNPVRGVPVRLDALAPGNEALAADVLVFRSAPNDVGRASENRVERLGPDRRRTTVSRTEDGGATWAPLFVDDVQRAR